jgi:hypothetical protein
VSAARRSCKNVRPYVENRVRVVPHSLIVLVLIALAQHTYCAAGHDGMQRAGSARVCVCVCVCAGHNSVVAN